MAEVTLADVPQEVVRRLAYEACARIARKYSQNPYDLAEAAVELCGLPFIALSPFLLALLSEDWPALYRLCNNALDRVRIRNWRASKNDAFSGAAKFHGDLIPGPSPEPIEALETEAAELSRPDVERLEAENLERDVRAWVATLKPKERAAVVLMVNNYDPVHPRAAKHYSDRDVHAACGLSRPRIAELRTDLLGRADRWITIAPEPVESVERPTHYTEDMTRLKDSTALRQGRAGPYTEQQAAETALPSEVCPENYDPYDPDDVSVRDIRI